METMMRLKNLAFSMLAVLGAMTCSTSFADTIKLVSTSGGSVAGVDVYPYNLSLNGSATTNPMMCINYDDHVTIGESWTVTGTRVSTSSSLALQEDAWLFSQVGGGKYSNADIQFAVWYILDGNVSSSAGYDATAKNLVSLAQAAAPGLSNTFLNNYMVYAPVLSNQTGWTDGTPQSYITADPIAVTPEPSSLLLLATGLFGAGVVTMRRRTVEAQNPLF